MSPAPSLRSRSRSARREASPLSSESEAAHRILRRRSPSPSPQREARSPRSEIAYSEIIHHSYCECFERIEYLNELKFTGRAWFWACKASLDKILWISVNRFLTRAIQKGRYYLYLTDCDCTALNPRSRSPRNDEDEDVTVILRQRNSDSSISSDGPTSPFSDDDPRGRDDWPDVRDNFRW